MSMPPWYRCGERGVAPSLEDDPRATTLFGQRYATNERTEVLAMIVK